MEQSKNKIYKYFNNFIMAILAVLFTFPLYWIITGSFKTAKVINARIPQWFCTDPVWDNYIKLFNNPAWEWLYNSVFIAIFAMLITCITASMAGYALAKKRFFGRKTLFTLLVCAMALPKQVILIPLLKLVSFLGIHDTLWAVILPSAAWPFGVFLLKQFSEGIPGEMLEAARIDGANETRTFLTIVLPMIKAGIGALAIFTFISVWNDYFLQLIMLFSRTKLTVSLGIATLQAELSNDFGLIMAGATLGSIPIISVFLVFQKYFTKGITMGAVKG